MQKLTRGINIYINMKYIILLKKFKMSLKSQYLHLRQIQCVNSMTKVSFSKSPSVQILYKMFHLRNAYLTSCPN